MQLQCVRETCWLQSRGQTKLRKKPQQQRSLPKQKEREAKQQEPPKEEERQASIAPQQATAKTAETGAAAAEPSYSPPAERMRGKSRSPPPRSRGGASASSASASAIDPKATAALAKPARDRNDEEVVAASMAKAAKPAGSKKSWADAAEEAMDDDGNDV